MTNHEAALELGSLLATPLKEVQREALVMAIGALENRFPYDYHTYTYGETAAFPAINYTGVETIPREVGVSYTDHT